MRSENVAELLPSSHVVIAPAADRKIETGNRQAGVKEIG
jgi:hypothetical protein